MTPAAVDVPRVHAALARLRELLADLDELVGSPTAEELHEDRGRRHITERVLTQLVELAVGINSHVAAARLGRAPGDYTESFSLAADVSHRPRAGRRAAGVGRHAQRARAITALLDA